MEACTPMLMDVVRQIKVTIPDLSQKIKQAREKDGRSVQVLATSAGISTAYWYQIEQEKRQWISEETLRGIEQALGLDLGVCFDD
ncbi:MAG: helix-turn-helix domain-containing protein [Nostoc sp.]